MANDYLWITVVGGIFSFLVGCGVGMNDLANAFGTTYGARILTLKQIVVVATLCEFTGALSLGAEVTSTISGGIADPKIFGDDPYILMYGMLCALVSSFIWLFAATMLYLPVSSTHSIAGGIMGFALVYGGGEAISWVGITSEFPFVEGVVPIVISWLISPLFTGAVSALLFVAVRGIVMRPANCVKRSFYMIPFIFGFTFFLEAFFILFKGAKSRLHWSAGRSAWVAALIGLAAGLISIGLIPLLKRRVVHLEKKAAKIAQERGCSEKEAQQNIVSGENSDEKPTEGNEPEYNSPRAEDPSSEPVTGDTVSEGDNSSNSTAAPKNAPEFDVEIFDPRVEIVFRYLQVFTAICASFAHGASDVSKAIGPFATIYSIYVHQEVVEENEIHLWILALGGAGLVVGLATFGIRLMRLLGERITKITPCRGFSAELSTALVVSCASGFGVPVSSTHCITGAVVAISAVDLGFRHVRWLMVAKMYGGWLATLVVTGLISAALFAQGIYAPSL